MEIKPTCSSKSRIYAKTVPCIPIFNLESRLLPLLLFPIFLPALLALVLAASDVLSGESDPSLWIKLLVGYDVIFTILSVLLFETVLHAE